MRIDITLLDDTGVPHDLAIQARPDHTAASLARALTALGHAQVQASEVTGLRNGALVGEPPRPIGATGLQVVGGPDSGLAYALRPGRTLIGRGADCELRLGDPAVSRRHVAVEVGRAGIQVTNLSDTAPARLSGVPLTGRQRLDAGDEVELGNTVIRLAGPQAQPDVAAARIAMPIPPHRSAGAPTGLGAAATSALTAVALALALGSAQLLWLGLIGPAGMIVSGLGGRRSRRRADRVQQHRHRDELKRVAAEIQAGVAAEAQARRRADPDPATLLAAADGQYGDRPDRGLTLRVGSGRAEAALAVQRPGEADEHPLLERVPLRVDLGAGPLRLLAPRPVALGQARWLVAQLVARTPPELLRISLDVDDEAAWHWLRWLPHLYPPHADRGGLEAWATAAPARRVLRVHDRARAAGLTLDVTDGAGTIQTSRPADDTGIRHRLDVQALDVRGEVLVDMLAAGDAERWARRLAARPSADGGLPEICRLVDLLGLSPAPTAGEFVARWAASGPGLSAAIGVTARGVVELDLDRDGPHALIAGTTGSGKSELLRSLVVALATCHPPTAVTFLLVDYKGGAAFGECARLPHVTGLVTDLDAHLTRRALRSLRAELQRRERLLAEAGAPDLHAYRSAPGRQPLPRLVVVVDEFATLVAELPEFVSGLIEVAQRGRSLGLHLILATQRPAGAVSAEIRANAALRIALRTLSAADSLDILDSPAAAALPSDLPGRAVWAAPTPVTFQVGVLAAAPEPEQITITELGMWRRLPQSVSTPAAPTSDALVAAITEAGGDAASPSAIWVDPLPEHVARRDLPAGVGALGLVDLPDEQRRDTLRLSPGMLIAGGPRSGRSTALAGVALAAAESGRAAIYVLDFAGDALRILAALPQVGSLLTPEDGIAPIEALTTRLSSCWAERRRGPEPDSAVLLLIDGWEQLCAALDAADPIGGASRVMALLRDAPAARASVVIAGDRSVLAPRLSALATERIILPLADPEGYEQLGLRRTAIPSSAAPGRGIRLRDGAELQLAHPGREPGWPATAGAVRALAARPRPAGPSLIRVRALPRRLTTPPAEAADGRMFLGIGGDEATPLWLSTGPGARVLVAGPSRSGRSSALHLILEAFGASSPLVVAPPGSPLIAAARGTGAPVADPRRGLESHPDLVLVDDAADLVDTPLGHELAALTDEAEISVVASLCTDRLLTLRGLPAALARSGLTILLQPSPGDAQLLGRAVPRHLLGGPPGRGVAFGAALVAPEHGPLPLQLRLAQWSAA